MKKDEKDDKKLDEETESMYISCCIGCLLGKNIRVCSVCTFNIGLPQRVEVLSKMAENNPLLLQVI